MSLASPITAVRYLIDYQTRHVANGHWTLVAGTPYRFPPWWANLWFTGHGLTAAVTVLTVVVLALGRWSRPAAMVAGGLALTMVVLSLVATVALPFYWTLWLPLIALLVGAVAVGADVRSRRDAARCCITLALVIGMATAASTHAAQARPQGPKMLPLVMRARQLGGPVQVVGVPVVVLREFYPQRLLRSSLADDLTASHVLIASTTSPPPDPAMQDLYDVNLAAGTLRLIYEDAEIRVFQAEGRMVLPALRAGRSVEHVR